jgi:multidrug efflux pump subunit AcrA (membrane-fusion protein)
MLKTQSSEMLVPMRSDDFLPPIGRWTSVGSLFIVGAIGTAIFLASVIEYNVTVKASATVRPVGELRLVQTAMEGTIRSIEVKENQQVKQGDAIAHIDDSQVQLKKSQLQGNIEQDKLQLAQIDAQIKAVRSQILAESQLRDRTVAAAQAELARNQRDWKDRQATALSDLKEAEATLSLARDGLTRYQKLVDSGAITQLQLREKEAAVQSAEAKLEKARSALNPSSANVAIAQERIAQEIAKGDSTLATLRKEMENLNQRRVEMQNQLHRHLKDLQQVENELQKSTIRATNDGIVLKLNLRNTNQFVRSGEAIAQIAPNAAPLVVKARVATQDIDKVLLCKYFEQHLL